MMQVEVAYASTTRQVVVTIAVAADCTVRDAIQQSGILEQCPEIDLAVNRVGIFSKQATLESHIKAGDRLEIYRPLLIDPKQARQQRVRRRANR